MKFFFRAKNKEGEIKEGVVEASNQELALNLIQKNELFPISVKKKEKKGLLSDQLVRYFSQVSAKELMVFFRQLAILIEARVPIIYSLGAIKDQTENSFFKATIEEVINDIQDGLSFSDALKKKPEVFSNLSVNIINSGENSGNLKKSVEYVADNLERNYNLSRKLSSAFVYPAVVLAVFLIIGFVFVTFIIPRLTEVIKDMGVDFPWYMKIIINFSDFMKAYWWIVLLGIIGSILGLLSYVGSEKGRRALDKLKIQLPVFGSIFRNL